MNCKNCQDPLEENAKFCDNCGGKVIKNRITIKFLLAELFAVMGLESLFFTTLKKMFTKPDEVINEYLTGVRKKYLNPFAYLAVGAALALITFNFYSDEFKAIQANNTTQQVKEMKELAEKDLSKIKDISKEELEVLKRKQASAKTGLKFQEAWLDFFLNYFNLMTFLFIPFYALISKWTYRKRYNFGEHIVINAYLQGSTMYISVITFIISIYTHPFVYFYSVLLYIIYYSITFSRLHHHSFGKALLKIIRFIFVLAIVLLLLLLLIIIVISILLFIIGFIIKQINPELLKNMFSPA